MCERSPISITRTLGTWKAHSPPEQSGYVTKRELHDVLVQRSGKSPQVAISQTPNAAVALAQRAAQSHAEPGARGLSSRSEVYNAWPGRGTYEIAAALKIQYRTVESYYAALCLSKLGLNGMYRTAATMRFIS